MILWEGTQEPAGQNLPELVREGAHIRVSPVLGTESQARTALGDKAVNGGAAPHLLRAARHGPLRCGGTPVDGNVPTRRVFAAVRRGSEQHPLLTPVPAALRTAAARVGPDPASIA